MKSLEIKISRWSYINTAPIELPSFCDASEQAYGVLVYIRTTWKGINKTSEVQAKSKVASTKTRTTIPRLEFCSAMLLAKIINKDQKCSAL